MIMVAVALRATDEGSSFSSHISQFLNDIRKDFSATTRIMCFIYQAARLAWRRRGKDGRDEIFNSKLML
jgi:hypothetical protein